MFEKIKFPHLQVVPVYTRGAKRRTFLACCQVRVGDCYMCRFSNRLGHREFKNVRWKELRCFWLIICLMLLLPACAADQPGGTDEEPSQALTWQEQYDLGVRYLSEGNYEEAILAFSAAIDIDAKRAPAYVGRGDAYVKSGKTEGNLTAAKLDYEKAIELDEIRLEAYLGLADVFVQQKDYEKEMKILEQGIKKTNSKVLKTKLSELETIYKKIVDTVQPLGEILIDGSGRNMKLSLTHPNLPEKIWVGSRIDGERFACFNLLISDEKSTVGVGTEVSAEEGMDGMVEIPGGRGCRHYLEVGFHKLNGGGFQSIFDDDTSVNVTCKNNTISWTFMMPEEGFNVSDITYAGYSINYFSLLEGKEIIEHATFKVIQGIPIYLNNESLLKMGFLISRDQFEDLYYH